MTEPVERYLRSLAAIRHAGVRETSYYGTLETLLNEIGAGLTPKVRCVTHPRNAGAGLPDGGLFTVDQLRAADLDHPTLQDAPLPARGAIEAKGTDEAVAQVAETEQIRRYVERYGQVLVTNFRDFLLVERDDVLKVKRAERFSLADDEQSFWAATIDPRSFAAANGEQLTEFLKRMLLHAAPLTSPRDVAFFLASYARDARARIEGRGLPKLVAVRQALEQALGLRFQDERGDHFFRSTLVQTLFYGIFSAWVVWSKQEGGKPGARFDWWDTGRLLRVPVVGALFHQVATLSNLESLGLVETLDWAGAALNRVVRPSFFAQFEEEQAVQYFYEPFLEAFDPALRKDLGVWYTPPEVVEYMVARVDAALRDELGIPSGLADPRVHVLDPCTGTGSFLIETLRRIHRTLEARGGDALLAHDLKRAAMERVHVFEILPAPFVVAHLQLGLLLQNLGAPLAADGSERAGIYLTNALTGWESTAAERQLPFLPELAEERDAAGHVKRDERILVVLGNPPYNGFSGTPADDEGGLAETYRRVTRVPAPEGQGLNDLYVRFFRVAERRIVEQTGRGLVCFISNYSWLDSRSHSGMRERFLDTFDSIWIDNLHGDRIISEYAPDGRSSETIFAVRGKSPGIKVGTAIALLVSEHGGKSKQPGRLYYRDFDQARAEDRRNALLGSLHDATKTAGYERLSPSYELALPFKPRAVSQHYLDWPLLPSLFPTSFPGVKTSRDDVVVDIDRDRLIERMKRYFDPTIGDEQIRRLMPGVMDRTARFDPEAVRSQLLKRGFLPGNVVQYSYRPFDVRWLYWEPTTKLLDEKRESYFPHVRHSNRWLVTQQKPRREWSLPQVIRSLGCIDLMDRSATCVPMFLRVGVEQRRLGQPVDDARQSSQEPQRLNVSEVAERYLYQLQSENQGELLFFHTLAVLHAPAYSADNAGALFQDWPRVPMPATADALRSSASLGRHVADLLDSEATVPGVTAGSVRRELQYMGSISSIDGKPLDPTAGDLALRCSWGYRGRGSIVMPGQGKLVARDFTAAERAAIASAVNPIGLTVPGAPGPLGETTYDVFLNDRAYWRNVPAAVWDFTIGGYPVLKKWLSYREADLLGRPLRGDEARLFTGIARRIAAILLLRPELDANYRAVVAATFEWSRLAKSPATMSLWEE